MVNKKGFIKTLESIIAIVLLIVFIFSIAAIGIKTAQEPPGNVVDSQDFIFKNILNTPSLRKSVLSGDPRGEVETLVEDTKPAGYGHQIQFCGLGGCLPPSGLPEKTIYVSSVYVVNTDNSDNSKILKVFLWEE